MMVTEWRHMSQAARFQETLRRLAIFDERFAEAGSWRGIAETSALDAKIVALLQLGASVAIGSSAVWPAMERGPRTGGWRKQGRDRRRPAGHRPRSWARPDRLRRPRPGDRAGV
jgi:hypothetical protein